MKAHSFQILLICLFSAGASAQNIISTLAGSDFTIPAGGIAAARFNPAGLEDVAVDSKGNLYGLITDRHVAIRLSPDGVVTSFAGTGLPISNGDGGPATLAGLHRPTGIAVDNQDNVFIAEQQSGRLRKIDNQGAIRTLVDGLPLQSVATGRDGSLYAATGTQIYRINPSTGARTLIAGTGAASSSGDGGPALNATFNSIIDMSVDPAGNLVVLELYGQRIRQVSLAGIVSTRWRPAANDPGFPISITITPQGQIFVSYFNDPRVYSLTPSGTLSVFAGTSEMGFNGDGRQRADSQFGREPNIASDSIGRLFLADSDISRIRRIDTNGIVSTVAGPGYDFLGDNGPATAARLSYFFALRLDNAGRLLFTDEGNHMVRAVQPDGRIVRVSGSGELGSKGDGGPALQASHSFPQGIAIDPAGNIYVGEFNCVIRRIAPNGIITRLAGLSGRCGYSPDGTRGLDASLGRIGGMDFDAAGNLLFVETTSHTVRRLTPAGVLGTVAGVAGRPGFSGDNGAATAASLNEPRNISVGPDGSIFIADTENQVIRKVATNGVISSVAGTPRSVGFSGDGGPASSARFNRPFGVFATPFGDLIVTDFDNQRIRRISPQGIISTIAGNGAYAFAGDGGLATRGSLSRPWNATMAPDGTLYIADSDIGRIRVVRAALERPVPSVPNLTLSARPDFTPTSSVVNLSGGALGLRYRIDPSSLPPWLTVSPLSGAMPASLAIEVNPVLAPQGGNSFSIRVDFPDLPAAAIFLPVSFSVPERPPARIAADIRAIPLAALTTGASTSTSILLRNTGQSPANLTAVFRPDSGAAWLRPALTTASVTPGGTTLLSLEAEPAGRAPGTYSGVVTVSGSSPSVTPINIPVTFSVASPQPILSLSQSAIALEAAVGGASPYPVEIAVLNTGAGSLSWSASVENAPWLTLSQSNGASTPGASSGFVLSANSQTLAPGDYQARIRVNATGVANAPKILLVDLSVKPASSQLGVELSPPALLFVSAQGDSPAAQSVLVARRSGAGGAFSSTAQFPSASPLFSHTPVSAPIPASSAARVIVQPTASSLSPGVYRGKITFLFDSGESRDLPVIHTVIPRSVLNAPTKLGAMRASASCNSQDLTVSPSFPGNNFAVDSGKGVPVSVFVKDPCGFPLVPEPGAVTEVTVVPNNRDPQFKLTHKADGVWTGDWTPSTGFSGNVQLKVLAHYSRQRIDQLGGLEINGAVRPTVRPVLLSGGVTDAAGFSSTATAAPGTLVSFFGENFADTGSAAGSFPLPTQLGNVRVRISGRDIPLLYAGPNQINAQIPFDIEPNQIHQVEVIRNQTSASPQEFAIAPSRPGLFSMGRNGSGQGAILGAQPDGSLRLADAATPVSPNQVVVIFCTGLGDVSPALPAGAAAPFNALHTTRNPPSVTIGGRPAAIAFSGLTPGFAGLYQINATVPAGTAAGSAVPVTVAVGGQSSNAVTIAVR